MNNLPTVTAVAALTLVLLAHCDAYGQVTPTGPDATQTSIEKQPTIEGQVDVAPRTDAEAVTEDDLELFELFVDALDEVQRNYVRPISRRELMDAAIEGVLSKLDDYSDYISPDEMPDFRREVEQEFGGIGIQLAVINGKATITTPLLNSPAFRANLMAGDVITHVDGEALEGLDLDDIIARLKGDIGTDVTLTILSGASEDQIERLVKLTREVVHIETVMALERDTHGRWLYVIEDEAEIGYIRITAFTSTTTNEVKAALEQLQDRGVQALILDLRFNPGGLLTTSVEVADLFLESGNIVRTAGRSGIGGKWKQAKPNSEFEHIPMVVLVNQYSASGSEIVAACLQDHGRAVVIGERTWGKGSVQQLIPMEAGRSALEIDHVQLPAAKREEYPPIQAIHGRG